MGLKLDRYQMHAQPASCLLAKTSYCHPKRKNSLSRAIQKEYSLRRNIILKALVFIFLPIAAQAQQQNIEYFPLPNCDGKNGFGVIYTTTSNLYKMAVSDVCFDENSNTLHSPEALGDWTLTNRGNDGTKIYEVVDSSVPTHQRARMWRFEEKFGESGQDSIENILFQGGIPHRSPLGRGQYSSLHGFLYSSLFEEQTLDAEYYLDFGFSTTIPFSADGRGAPTLSFNGTTKFSSTEAIVDFGSNTDTGLSSDAGSAVNFLLTPNGGLRGGGYIQAKNPKLAGHEPFDWRVAKLKIIAFKGIVVGPSAERLVAYAILEGKYRREDQEIVPMNGFMFIHGYRK